MVEKHFWQYCLQAFSRGEKLKRHIKDCFKINGKQRIIIRRGRSVSKRLVKLTRFECFQLQLSGYQELPQLSFASRVHFNTLFGYSSAQD